MEIGGRLGFTDNTEKIQVERNADYSELKILSRSIKLRLQQSTRWVGILCGDRS